jgi:hypothetical protein
MFKSFLLRNFPFRLPLSKTLVFESDFGGAFFLNYGLRHPRPWAFNEIERAQAVAANCRGRFIFV